MRDVHVSQFQFPLECAFERGISRQELLDTARFRYELEDLCSRDYVPWGEFARLLNAMSTLGPDEPWPSLISRDFLNLPLNRRMRALLRHVSDPLVFYWAMDRFFGPYQFPCIDSSITHRSAREIVFHHHIQAQDFLYSELYITASQCVIENAPRILMGLPMSRCTWSCDGDREIEFHITVPNSRSVVARVKDAGRRVFGEPASLGVLEQQLSEIQGRLKLLDETERTLEHRIQSRTAELDLVNRGLIEARDAAQRESQAKSHYLANLSHELRTPLNAIIGGTELVLEEMQDDGVETYAADLERINQAGRQLLGLIEHVLDLSKIEADRMTLDESSIELVAFLENLLAPMELLARQKAVELTLEYASSHTLMRGDAQRLGQILTNLLGNALKFSPGAPVCLRTRDVEGDHGRIVFEVEDHGIGIEPDALESLFKPFVQANKNIHKEFGGTGLGLTIAHKFAGLMGGSLTVQSAVGEGTTFRLELPLLPPSHEADS